MVEVVYFVFTRMPSESYCRSIRSLLSYLCYVFRALINSLVVDSEASVKQVSMITPPPPPHPPFPNVQSCT